MLYRHLGLPSLVLLFIHPNGEMARLNFHSKARGRALFFGGGGGGGLGVIIGILRYLLNGYEFLNKPPYPDFPVTEVSRSLLYETIVCRGTGCETLQTQR